MGSTVLYQLLATSPNVSTLMNNDNWAGEGQFIPGVQDSMLRDAWNPEVAMPWDKIKRVWDLCWDQSKPILADKSPPHVCRAAAIQEHFSQFGEVAFLAQIRSPFCTRQAPSVWVTQAQFQRHNIETLNKILWFTYEDLCTYPVETARRIQSFLPELGKLDPRVKQADDPKKGGRFDAISNRNRVTKSLEQARQEVLSSHEELLGFFGYDTSQSVSSYWPELRVKGLLPDVEVSLQSLFRDPGQVQSWLAAEEVFSSPPVAGGEFTCRVDKGFPRPHLIRGEFLEFSATHLRLSWIREDKVRQPANLTYDHGLVDIQIRNTTKGSFIVVNHDVLPPRYFKEYKAFWQTSLTRLADVVGSALSGA